MIYFDSAYIAKCYLNEPGPDRVREVAYGRRRRERFNTEMRCSGWLSFEGAYAPPRIDALDAQRSSQPLQLISVVLGREVDFQATAVHPRYTFGNVREVVIVDDDEGFVATLSVLLEKEGYRVVGHHALDPALEYMASHRPDFLITDLRLGAQSGWAVVDFCRLHQPDLPVVVVTGFVDEWQDVALRLGTPVFLKPFDPEDLMGFLRHRILPH